MAGAATLADLMEEDPGGYHQRVMQVFEALLEHPPRFEAPGQAHNRHIDYESLDTAAIIAAINGRPKRYRALYQFEFEEGSPFISEGIDKARAWGSGSADPGPATKYHTP